MDRNSIKEIILKVVEENLGNRNVDLDADLQKDYDIDSIGVLDFIMRIEEEFGIEFADADLENMKSINSVIDRVDDLTK